MSPPGPRGGTPGLSAFRAGAPGRSVRLLRGPLAGMASNQSAQPLHLSHSTKRPIETSNDRGVMATVCDLRTQCRAQALLSSMYRVTVMILMTLVVVAAGVAAYWVASVLLEWL